MIITISLQLSPLGFSLSSLEETTVYINETMPPPYWSAPVLTALYHIFLYREIYVIAGPVKRMCNLKLNIHIELASSKNIVAISRQ